MPDWTSGYVADIAYTYGYYAEMNPLRAQLLLLNARLAVPRIATACELGFGQGVSANMHAAASPVRWYGTDFNPSQAAFAQQLSASYSDGAQLYADGPVVMVWIDRASGRPVPLPEVVRSACATPA